VQLLLDPREPGVKYFFDAAQLGAPGILASSKR